MESHSVLPFFYGFFHLVLIRSFCHLYDYIILFFITNTPQLGYSTIYLALLMLIDFCFQLLTLTNEASMNFPN